MTPSRYFFATLGKAFGFHRRSLRMADAASEMHLLREAEAHLGMAVWDQCEHIEEISIEYWNLRKLIKERDRVIDRINDCQARLDKAHADRAELLTTLSDLPPELMDRRTALLVEMEELARQRDQVVVDARAVRRTYDGLKMKLEVVTREDSAESEAAEQVRGRLRELREEFNLLKERRLEIADRIEKGDDQIDSIEAELETHRQARRSDASKAFQVIGEANKELSNLRAELGVLDIQIRQLQGEIGRFVSRHALQNNACGQAARDFKGMVEVMRALRRSIALNHRLAGDS